MSMDIEENIQLLYDDVLGFHKELEEEYPVKAGIRDVGLIESAVNSPFATFGGQALFPSLFEKAACLFYGLSKNHGFIDGNKRVATHSMSVYLFINGYDLVCTQDELVDFAIGIADSKESKDVVVEKIVLWLESYTKML